MRAELLPLGLAVPLLGTAGCETATDDGWDPVSPAAVGLEGASVAALEEAVAAGRFANLHGVLVAKDGRLVLETYAPGVDGSELHYVASVTKSVGSLVLGIALDRGFLGGLEGGALDLGLADLFPEHRGVLGEDERKSAIRLRHVLSMTAGFSWDEDSHPYDDPRNDWVRVRDAADPVRRVLEQPVETTPGSTFAYSGGMSTLLGALLERASGGAPRDFAERELFGPLGIDEYEWRDLEGGLLDVPGGLHLRPRDMLKIGRLCLDGGRWNGEPVVSEAWLAESTRRHVDNRDGPDYGLHWWVGDYHFRQSSTRVVAASGHGGQKIFAIPEHALVVVVVQQVFDNPMADANVLSVLSQYVLPAATGDAVGEASPSAHDPEAFVGRYRGERGTFSIELRDGALWALSEDAPPMQLDGVGPLRFRGAALGLIEVDFAFELDASGAAVGGRSTFGFASEEFTRAVEGG